MTAHTILLLQTTTDKKSRTFLDRESVEDAILGLVNIFEAKLRELNPSLPNISYELVDIDGWVDNMPDLSALVYSSQLSAYVPHGKSWIKQRMHNHFMRLAAANQRR